MAPSSAIRRALLGLLAPAALALGARALALAQGGEPAIRRDEGYVGAEACGECHARQHATWHASYHRTMTTVASPRTALATFSGRTPELGGVAWLLETEGDALFATPVARDGRPIGQRGRVALITGSHHYQIYWLAARDGGGLTPLPLVWHRAEARFVPRTSMFLMPRSSETVQETGRWETTCIKCHTTNGTGAPPPDGKPTVAALGIECEACHGPGAAHVAARAASAATGPDELEPAVPGAARDEIVFPGELAHDRSSEICGQCHAIRPLATPEARETWRREGFAYRPGDELEATRPLLFGTRERNPPDLRGFLDRNPKTLAELFWKDGEVRVSGREFNGLVESPCFERGNLACISCHEMHPSRTDPRDLSTWADDQLRRGMDGPGACLGCHADLADAERLRAHTRHDAASSGSDCLNCHMPRTTYGLTKAIRSHEISSPDVGVALASGRPNACNLCHLDRPLGWTADLLRDWYGHERPALEPDRESVAESVLWALEGDAGLRALAACALEWPPAREVSGTGWMPPLQSTLLLDGYDAVRWIALRGLRLEPRFRDFDLDFTAELETQRNAVRERVLTDWRARGLEAAPDRREAVLVRPDGTLDEPRFLRIFARRDDREVRLAE